MNNGLLSGLRVIESSAFIAAPLAGMALTQFGANVIRIDLPGGGIDYSRMPIMPGGRSFYWTGLNKGKRSLAIDFRRPEGREIVQALATAEGADAGVLLTNIAVPWLSHTTLAAKRSDVISCTIEGNFDGSTAVDYTVNCAVGFPAITGGGSISQPINHVLPAWDIACAYQAAFAVAAAVGRRRSNGEGAELRIALSDVAFSTLSHLGISAEAEILDRERPSLGNYLFGGFGKDFGTKDGRRLYVAAISLGQWKSLVEGCGMEAEIRTLEAETGLDFTNEAERYQAREAIAGLVERWTSALDFSEIAFKFDAHRVCWGPYQTVRQALQSDPRLSTANPIFETIHTPGIGSHLSAGTPVRVTGSRGPHLPAPIVGEHTDEILAEILGLDSATLGQLHDRGIIAGADTVQ